MPRGSRRRRRSGTEICRAVEPGVFPVELEPDPLVQVPVDPCRQFRGAAA